MKPKKSVEQVFHDKQLIAVIVYAHFQKEGIEFFTAADLSQQLAYMKRPQGHVIARHLHNPVKRNVTYTLETLFIKKGRVKVDFYTKNKEFIGKRILSVGDIILLVSGGHGFKILEDAEILEVKQGPYNEEKDKKRF